MPRRAGLLPVALIVAAPLLGCRTTPVVALEITAGTLVVGDSVRLFANFAHRHCCFLNDHSHFDSRTRPEAFRWSVGDTAVASVDRLGVVRARRVGSTQVTAVHGDVRALHPAVVTVQAAP